MTCRNEVILICCHLLRPWLLMCQLRKQTLKYDPFHVGSISHVWEICLYGSLPFVVPLWSFHDVCSWVGFFFETTIWFNFFEMRIWFNFGFVICSFHLTHIAHGVMVLVTTRIWQFPVSERNTKLIDTWFRAFKRKRNTRRNKLGA